MELDTLNTLIIARTLLIEAEKFCLNEDKYSASIGLLLLQDVIELVLTACIIEKGIDVKKDVQYLNYNQKIKILENNKCPIPKSFSLKATNLIRVLIKHYGRTAEPTAVRQSFIDSQKAVDLLTKDVFGKILNEIMIHDVLIECDAKTYLSNANEKLEKGEYFPALTEIRKAFYIEFELPSSIYDWKEFEGSDYDYWAHSVNAGGALAPRWTKNKGWIDINVKDNFDYIQHDREIIKINLIEWGISTQEYWNLINLTPRVFLNPVSKNWDVEYGVLHIKRGANERNVRYCLDKAVLLIQKKQNHFSLHKSLGYFFEDPVEILMLRDEYLYVKATNQSTQKELLKEGEIYNAVSFVPSLGESKNDEARFVVINTYDKENNKITFGYLPSSACEVIQE